MPLIDYLIKAGWLKTPRIIKAFLEIKRADFLPEALKNLAELNEALPIGYGQTISQPLVVAFMLEQLQPEEGDKILDVGAGSGWTSALLGEIVGDKGKVIAIEFIPELKTFGENNAAKYSFIKKGQIQFFLADGSKGCEKEDPFDKILCSAAVPPPRNKISNGAQKAIPPSWKKQLKVGGRIVAPIGSSIWLFIKRNETEFEEVEYPGFTFVPLVEQ